MRVLREGRIEVWIWDTDLPARVTCYRGEESITILLLEKPVVYSQSNSDNRSFRKNALDIVKGNSSELYAKWLEYQKHSPE